MDDATLIRQIGTEFKPLIDDERGRGATMPAQLTAKLGEQQQRLEANYTKLKEMRAMANKAVGAADSASARLTRAWAAKEAVLARDGADLAKLQARNEDRKNWKPTVSDINSRLIAFFAESGKELPESLNEQFTRDRIAFNQTMEDLQATDKKIETIYQSIKGLVVAAIDLKKARLA